MVGFGDGDTGAGCGVCSGLAVNTPEQRHWADKCRLGISNFNDKISFN